MTLHAVPDIANDTAAEVKTGKLPMFEGEKVEGLRAKLVSTTNLELGDDHHRIDETTRLLVVGRVSRVDHVVDDKSGRLTRVETFKIVDALEVPWDSVSHLLFED